MSYLLLKGHSYPQPQTTILNRMLEECRWLYNKTLATRKNAYEQEGKSLGLYELQNMIPQSQRFEYRWHDESAY